MDQMLKGTYDWFCGRNFSTARKEKILDKGMKNLFILSSTPQYSEFTVR